MTQCSPSQSTLLTACDARTYAAAAAAAQLLPESIKHARARPTPPLPPLSTNQKAGRKRPSAMPPRPPPPPLPPLSEVAAAGNGAAAAADDRLRSNDPIIVRFY